MKRRIRRRLARKAFRTAVWTGLRPILMGGIGCTAGASLLGAIPAGWGYLAVIALALFIAARTVKD